MKKELENLATALEDFANTIADPLMEWNEATEGWFFISLWMFCGVAVLGSLLHSECLSGMGCGFALCMIVIAQLTEPGDNNGSI